jgi:tetratricopeptide (TPR) repeat protein
MLRKAPIFIAVFFLAASFVCAQTPPNQQRNRVDDYAIRGKIVIPNQRESDQRIEVKLEKSALQVIQTTYSDSAGNFDFRNLAPGSYYVAVTLEGYEPVHQIVEIFNSFGNASVTVFLTKPAIELRERLTGLDAADPDVVDISQMKDNLPKKAVQDYEKALDEKQKGKIDSAIKLLEEAVQLAPAFFHAHNNLGILYQSLKRYAEAEKEFKRSHELNAKTERPLVNLGSLYIEQCNLL